MYLSFFVSPLVLRAPSTDRPETLPHDRNLAEFYNPTPKTRGLSRQKIWGQNMQNFGQFWTLQSLIANISGTAEGIQNRKTVQAMAIPSAFNEKSPLNFGPLAACEFGPTKMHFLAYYISALRGCCALKFLHGLEIDQDYLGHTPTGGSPKKI